MNEPRPVLEKELTEKIIGAAIEVHKALGPGLLESAYEECLCRELSLRGIPFEKQRPLPVEYRGIRLDCGYRLDLLVDPKVVKDGISRFVMAPRASSPAKIGTQA